MKTKLILLLVFINLSFYCFGQATGAFTVGGDFNKFYPVTFHDTGWPSQSVSEVQISRFDVHENSNSRGALASTFRYHTSQWGHGANFIQADIAQTNNLFTEDIPFIAGWRDATLANASFKIIIWLRGGGTTYHYTSVYSNTVTVYDGIANALPYLEANGPSHTYKTTVDAYVNSSGLTSSSAYFTSGKNNYFEGNVGIGTATPTEKLSVKGKIRAQEVKVEMANWSDFVFDKGYVLPTLQETEKHIKEKGHLPGIPSAAEVEKNGIELGEMNKKLLQKIEELTLYLIEKDKKISAMEERLDRIEKLKPQKY